MEPSPNRGALALLGPRGAGKSTVGAELARRLALPFVDLDGETLRAGRWAGWRAGSAGELLQRAGQAWFRELEAGALRRILEPSPRLVLATGGGVVERADARTWLARTARCVFLSVPPDVLARRLRADPGLRPALLGDDAVAEIEPLLARREPWYRALAEAVIECGDDPPAAVVERVLAHLSAGPAR
ncbi:MAG TPA: shikimate kinase [Planctomycetota bacterium]